MKGSDSPLRKSRKSKDIIESLNHLNQQLILEDTTNENLPDTPITNVKQPSPRKKVKNPTNQQVDSLANENDFYDKDPVINHKEGLLSQKAKQELLRSPKKNLSERIVSRDQGALSNLEDLRISYNDDNEDESDLNLRCPKSSRDNLNLSKKINESTEYNGDLECPPSPKKFLHDKIKKMDLTVETKKEYK